MSAARDILAKHLPKDIPYHNNGHGNSPTAAREEIINAAISAIFSPNGESNLATITFRDAKRRTIRSADLVSGAALANIAQTAIEEACVREIETGKSGLRLADMLSAVSEEFTGVARCLTPFNCRNYISDLPQDMDIVSVEPVARNVRQPHRYLNLDIDLDRRTVS
jgi:hypothetical protein